MPSTRSLGTQYFVSRAEPSSSAFEQLQAEGYTRTEVGSGTYVASGVPDESLSATRKPAAFALPTSKAAVSKHLHQFLKDVEVLPASRSIGKAFRSHEPAIDLFPVDLWARIASRVLRRAPRSLYGHGNVAGYQPLRRAIAEYVGASRGVRCSAEQIIVTSGAQHALDLIGRFLLAPGDQVWMEDPGYSGALQTLRATGARIVPVPVDEDGLIVQKGRKLAPKAKLAYVTPANQFPMGVVMSADRRMELLRWASSANAWIVEDEYDAEYRYFGRPVAALHALDSSGCVIYVGTFTKMLFNALRLGFMVLPERLVEAFSSARSFVDRHPPTLDQAILAEFIIEGHFGHHIRRMRQAYAERIERSQNQPRTNTLSGVLDVIHSGAGMRTLGWLKTWKSDHEAAQQAQKLGLEVTPLSVFTAKYQQPPALMLGFASCNPAELRRGVSVLATALRPRYLAKMDGSKLTLNHAPSAPKLKSNIPLDNSRYNEYIRSVKETTRSALGPVLGGKTQ